MDCLLLSICIPTYNHADYLEALLNSIPTAYADKIEICVSSHSSTDHTEEIIERCSSRFKYFRHKKHQKFCTFDENVLNSVALATGKYCWTIGSDDRLLSDALGKILKILEEDEPAILIAPPILHDVNGRWERKISYLSKSVDRYSFKFGEIDKMTNYFNSSIRLAAIGCFLSSNIFKRSLWMDAEVEIGFAFGYIHIDKLFCILANSLNRNETFLFLNETFILATAGNDGVALGQQSCKQRMFFDFNSITRIAEKYIHDFKARCACVRIITRENHFTWLYRSMIVPECNEEELDLLYSIFPSWWITFMKYFSYKRNGIIHRSLKFVRDQVMRIRYRKPLNSSAET
jgi:abequosyltransferase